MHRKYSLLECIIKLITITVILLPIILVSYYDVTTNIGALSLYIIIPV